MKKITLLIVLSFLSVGVFAKPQSVTLDVPSMNCATCPFTVKMALKKVDGVTDAEVSYKTKQAVVKYDDEKTTVAKLVEATTNAGFPSTVNK